MNMGNGEQEILLPKKLKDTKQPPKTKVRTPSRIVLKTKFIKVSPENALYCGFLNDKSQVFWHPEIFLCETLFKSEFTL